MTEETKTSCEACGKELPAGIRFCPACGKRIAELSLGERFKWSLLRTIMWLAIIGVIWFLLLIYLEIKYTQAQMEVNQAKADLNHAIDDLQRSGGG